MNIREDPTAVAFYNAAAAYCRLLESQPTADDTWGAHILQALSQLYACGHALVEAGLDNDADLPSDFEVTDE